MKGKLKSMKSKNIKNLSILGASVLMTSNIVPLVTYAASNTKDSIGSIDMEDDGMTIGVDETQDQKTTYSEEIEEGSTQSADVYVSQASTFGVKIPKVIILDGVKNEENINKANYVVSISNSTNIGGKEKIKVVPDASFLMSQEGKNDIDVTVIQDKKEWLHNEITTLGNGEVSATGMTAGSWKGTFNFNIELESESNGSSSNADYANIAFNDLTWEQIATLSDSNEFLNYYEVGATKTFEYAGNTYTAEVIGVNTYNNGELTFLTKELLPTQYGMNSTNTNVGGWPSSQLRTTLNSTIYNGLPEDLKNVITPKTLKYETSNGNVNNITMVSATDNLWLPTQYELIGNWIKSQTSNDYWNKMGKATSAHQKIYDAYTDITNYQDSAFIKTLNGSANIWWLASPYLDNTSDFSYVNTGGRARGNYFASTLRGVPLGFVI